MSQQTGGSSSAVSGNWSRRRGVRERGIPKHCRCGEKAVIKTSGTVRNPGRLFYCCPKGSEEENGHLFTWTDERIVEEVEDLKCMTSELDEEINGVRAELAALEKRLHRNNLPSQLSRNQTGCCSIL